MKQEWLRYICPIKVEPVEPKLILNIVTTDSYTICGVEENLPKVKENSCQTEKPPVN